MGRIDLNELIQSANNKGLFVNVCIEIGEAEWVATLKCHGKLLVSSGE